LVTDVSNCFNVKNKGDSGEKNVIGDAEPLAEDEEELA
jgi:hypothetical protein